MDDLVSEGEEKPESEIAPGRAPSEEKMSTSELDSASRTAQAAAPMPSSSSISNLAAPVANRKLKGYVGFANLPNQVHKQSIRKGFDFTILVVGEDGLGKATLLNSLFNEEIATPSDSVNSNGRIRVIQHDATIEESGIQLRLTALVTSNFAGALNNEGTWNDIVDAVENRFNEYLDQETITSKRSYIDRRIHACLYMIAPTGHCLKALDLEVLKRLHDKVNIIPVIAKGDSMTEDELKTFKQRVLADLNAHKIRTFVPELDDMDDEETKMEKTRIIARIPFAVSASTALYENGNRKIRGRKYPWGVVETENEEHNDFAYLRQLLIRSHMEELRELTVSGMYERHRSRKMATTGYDQNHPENAPFLYFADEKKAHDLKMQKMEAEMRMVFEQKVHEKEAKLKAAEEELYAQHRAAITNLEKQRAELEERKRRIEEGRPGTPERKKRGLRW